MSRHAAARRSEPAMTDDDLALAQGLLVRAAEASTSSTAAALEREAHRILRWGRGASP